MRISQLQKRSILRLFAAGKSLEEVAEILNRSDAHSPDNQPGRKTEAAPAPARKPRARISMSRLEKFFEEYLAMPISEKQRQTLLAEQVSDRMHRLLDDIADLKRVDDALLEKSEEKTLIPLLDIKRKIKERMAKEDMPRAGGNSPSDSSQEAIRGAINECCERVLNYGNPE
ncbi:hypothetical protein HZA56_04815 [Candidatus Poribacteria bacterium]|nr:hypothetical protein [Candidatus Poribacteria bacterium]